MNKIIFLIEQPLDARNYDRFGIETWVERGWTVEIWDLTPLAYPAVWRDFVESGREIHHFDGHFSLTSLSHLTRQFRKIGRVDHFIDLTGNNYFSLRAKLRLVRAGAIRTTCDVGSIPVADGRDYKPNLARVLFEVFSQNPVKSAKRIVNGLLARAVAPRVKPGLIAVSGEKSMRRSQQRDCQAVILKAHNLDYDLFLRSTKTLGMFGPGEYGVFLDQNLCFAPDYIYETVAPYATPEKYFPTICRGLRAISGALQIPIKVAAHPRLPDKKRYLDYFEGIAIEYGRTADLIANCRFAICHYTTAIQFAVLFKKPIIFVTTDELARSPAAADITSFAAALERPITNFDESLDEFDWHALLKVDVRKYDDYRREYIKMENSPEVPFWQIVIDYMESSAELSSARYEVASGA